MTVADLLVPAAFAGVVAIAVSWAIERFGGRLGGVLGTAPSTIVPAALGIYAQSASTAEFRLAMFAVPLGMLLDVGFLYLWRVIPERLPATLPLRRRLTMVVSISLGAWLLAAVIGTMAMARIQHEHTALVGFAATLAMACAGLASTWKSRPAPRGGRKVGVGMVALRGVGAAVAVAVAVALAAAGGALAAGVASVFPAIFLTTMVGLWLAQGEAVQSGAIGPMMLGATAVAVYALGAAFLLPAWGVVAGSIASWFGAVLVASVPALAWLRWRSAR